MSGILDTIGETDIAKGDRIAGTQRVFAARLRGKEDVVVKAKFDKDFHIAKAEANLLSTFDHQNIVKVYGYCVSKSEAYVVLERAVCSVSPEALRLQFPGCSGERMRVLEVFKILLHVAAAVSYIHKRKILHRDLKPSNILLFSSGTYKLCDFEISKRMGPCDDATGTGNYSCAHASPEAMALDDPVYCVESDLYSFGSTMCELLTGAPPFGPMDAIDIVTISRNGINEDGSKNVWPSVIPQTVRGLVRKLLHYEPCERGTLDDAIKVLEEACSLVEATSSAPESTFSSWMSAGNTELLVPGWLASFDSVTLVAAFTALSRLSVPVAERPDIAKRVGTWDKTIADHINMHIHPQHTCTDKCVLDSYTSESDLCYVINAVLSLPSSTRADLESMGPYVKLLFDAVQRLGKYQERGYRVLFADEGTLLHDSFCKPEIHFSPGTTMQLFQVGSFAKSLPGIKNFLIPTRNKILLRCRNLTAFDIAPHSVQGHQEREVIVLPPSSFTVIRAYRTNAHTLEIDIDQNSLTSPVDWMAMQGGRQTTNAASASDSTSEWIASLPPSIRNFASCSKNIRQGDTRATILASLKNQAAKLEKSDILVTLLSLDDAQEVHREARSSSTEREPAQKQLPEVSRLLHIAAKSGSKACCETLLERGAKVHAADYRGYKPIHIAVEGGHVTVVELLLGRSAFINEASTQDGSTPLVVAVLAGHERMVTLLTQRGADVSIARSDGKTPLMLAARKGFTEAVRALLAVFPQDNSAAKREYVNQKARKEGAAAMHEAAQGGHVKVITELLRAGADANITFQVQDTSGLHSKWTPLLLAVCNGHHEATSILFDAMNTKNSNGRVVGTMPPLVCAMRFCGVQSGTSHAALLATVGVLLGCGADVNEQDHFGMTALHFAVEKQETEVIKLLCGHGANPSLPDRNCSTPVTLAAVIAQGPKRELILGTLKTAQQKFA